MALVLCVSMVSSLSLPREVQETVNTCMLNKQGGYCIGGPKPYYVLSNCAVTENFNLAYLDSKGGLFRW